MRLVYSPTIGVAYDSTMEPMNVQEMTDRLKVRCQNISDSTKQTWDNSINWIDRINVANVDHYVAAEWLERADTFWGVSTFKARVGFLKGLWNKARKKKLYKGENPWIDLDDVLAIGLVVSLSWISKLRWI